MERAESLVVGTGLLQCDEIRHHVHYLCRLLYLVCGNPVYHRGSKVRLSERNPKETIKREQKKFIFYAACEFLRPSGQFYLSICVREHLRGIGLVICAHFSVSTYREV